MVCPAGALKMSPLGRYDTSVVSRIHSSPIHTDYTVCPGVERVVPRIITRTKLSYLLCVCSVVLCVKLSCHRSFEVSIKIAASHLLYHRDGHGQSTMVGLASLIDEYASLHNRLFLLKPTE